MSYLKTNVFKEFYDKQQGENLYGSSNQEPVSRLSVNRHSRARRALRRSVRGQRYNLTDSQSDYVRQALDETAEAINEELDGFVPRLGVMFDESPSMYPDDLTEVEPENSYDAIDRVANMDSQLIGSDYASELLESAGNPLNQLHRDL